MPDQAEKLRRMVAEGSPRAALAAPAPPMIVVTGGKGGVGTTTVAMNLAAALSDSGRRVVLIDAARHHADLAELAGIHFCGGGTLSDVLLGRTRAADALVPGPAGTLLLADRWGAKPHANFSSAVQQRMLAELDSLGEVADVLVVDTGSGVSQWTERFWQHAQLVIVACTCDDVAVLDAYATVKLGTVRAIDAEVRFVVNQCGQDREAADAQRRLASACQRFLGRTVRALPSLPLHVMHGTDTHEENIPRVWQSPNTPFGHAVLWLASAVIDLLPQYVTAGNEPDNADSKPRIAVG